MYLNFDPYVLSRLSTNFGMLFSICYKAIFHLDLVYTNIYLFEFISIDTNKAQFELIISWKLAPLLQFVSVQWT